MMMSCRLIHRRCALMTLARDCKSVVETRIRVRDAASVMQRAWRTSSGRRLRRPPESVDEDVALQDTADDVDIWLLLLRGITIVEPV